MLSRRVVKLHRCCMLESFRKLIEYTVDRRNQHTHRLDVIRREKVPSCIKQAIEPIVGFRQSLSDGHAVWERNFMFQPCSELAA